MSERKFRGKAIAYLYSSQSGKTSRTMSLDEKNLDQLRTTLLESGPGSQIRLKETTDAYRNKKSEEMAAAGKKGGPAKYILEILTAAEIAAEKAEFDAQRSANTSGDGSL